MQEIIGAYILKKKASQAVTHPSTDYAQCCLTSVIGRGHSADWAIQEMRKSRKKFQYINVIVLFPDPFPFFFPIPAWREFHFTSCVLSSYLKEAFKTEKSSIFNFGYG